MKFKNQQQQTKNFFDQEVYKWAERSEKNQNIFQNTIQQRNNFVSKLAKEKKIRTHLDVGCGAGDLLDMTSPFVDLGIGVDFSSKMIEVAKKKLVRNKGVLLSNASIFEFVFNKKVNLVSANGFIEYLTIKEIKDFFLLVYKNLTKNGYFVFSSRNRLFNLFSLNKFSELELNESLFFKFYKESIDLTNHSFKQYVKSQIIPLVEVKYKQPKTNIKVDVRHQFSPLQLIGILTKLNFKIIDLSPINYHPVTPSMFSKNEEFKKISNVINYKIISDEEKIKLIPFSSTFMLVVKK